MHQLGDNHADGARRVAAAVAQLLGNDIGKIVVLAGKLLDFLPPLARYAGARDTVATDTPSSRAMSFIVSCRLSSMMV